MELAVSCPRRGVGRDREAKIMRDEGGFTLIEMVIGVMVLGIISGGIFGAMVLYRFGYFATQSHSGPPMTTRTPYRVCSISAPPM